MATSSETTGSRPLNVEPAVAARSLGRAKHRRRLRLAAAALAAFIGAGYALIAAGIVLVLDPDGLNLVRQLAFASPALAAYAAGAFLLWKYDSRMLAAMGAALQAFVILSYTDMLVQRIHAVEAVGLVLSVSQAILLVLLLGLAVRRHPHHPSKPLRRRVQANAPPPSGRAVADAVPVPPSPPRPLESRHNKPGISVLVAHASRRGGVARIADMIATELRSQGFDVHVEPADTIESLDGFHSVILGAAIYRGRWHRDARRFVYRHYTALVQIPVWMFSSGPLDHSAPTRPPVRHAKRLIYDVGAEDHITFGGRLAERPSGWVAQLIARDRAGDWLDPTAVAHWTRHIARSLLVLVGQQPCTRTTD